MYSLAASPIHADHHVTSQLTLNTDRGLVAVKQREIGGIDLDALLGHFDVAHRIRSTLRRISKQSRLKGWNLLVDDLYEFTESDVTQCVDRQRVANIDGLHAAGSEIVFVWKDIGKRTCGKTDPAVADGADRRILSELLPNGLGIPIQPRAAADHRFLVPAGRPGESELRSKIQITSRRPG